GVISGPGELYVSSTGASTGILTLNADETFTGGMHITGGQIDVRGALGSGTIFIDPLVHMAMAKRGNLGDSGTALDNTITNPITLGAGAPIDWRIDGGTTGKMILSGPISGPNDIRKNLADNTPSGTVGLGTLMLSGNNSYTGQTLVSNGVLIAASA